MDKILEQSLLYDFYGELLTSHQKEIYEDFALNDLSLAEIAEMRDISRQGVHDIVRRCNRQLSGYEEKLHLVERFLEIQKKIGEIRLLAHELSDSEAFDRLQAAQCAQKIEGVCGEILKNL